MHSVRTCSQQDFVDIYLNPKRERGKVATAAKRWVKKILDQ